MLLRKIFSVLKVKREPCGITLFDMKLRESLYKLGIDSPRFEIENIMPDNYQVCIFHYIPSLYVGSTKMIADFFSITTALKVVIVHGTFPNYDFEYRADTVCPDFYEQLNIIDSYSDVIITLSDSATNALKGWITNTSIDLYTLYHPGLDNNNSFADTSSGQPYVFMGGITRAKKDFYSVEYLQLINSLESAGISVWLHSTTNAPYNSSLPPVWKFTCLQLDWHQWSKAISNATWVLCPYNTKIQTVSGIIAESISAGKMVLATAFPYSIEISCKYNDLIVVDDDLKKWPEIILSHHNKPASISYPDWSNFTSDLLKIINSSRPQPNG